MPAVGIYASESPIGGPCTLQGAYSDPFINRRGKHSEHLEFRMPRIADAGTVYNPAVQSSKAYRVNPTPSTISRKASFTSVTAHFTTSISQKLNPRVFENSAEALREYRKHFHRYDLYIATTKRGDISPSEESTSPKTPHARSTNGNSPEITGESSTPIAKTHEIGKRTHGLGLGSVFYSDCGPNQRVVPCTVPIYIPFGLESVDPFEQPFFDEAPMTPEEAELFEHTQEKMAAMGAQRDAEVRMRAIREAGRADPKTYGRLGDGTTMLRPRCMAKAEDSKWTAREIRDQATVVGGRNAVPRPRTFLGKARASKATFDNTSRYTSTQIWEEQSRMRERNSLATELNAKPMSFTCSGELGHILLRTRSEIGMTKVGECREES